MPSMKHYWKVNSKVYQHPIFGQIAFRYRYESILRALRFYELKERVAKKEKIQFVINHCVQKFKKFYSTPKQLSTDEALLGFKGRLSYKQYIPLKRSQFGIKLYELCALYGYVLDIILYTGTKTVYEESTKEKGHAYNIAMKYQKKGHAVYLDNFYTSVTLADDLFKRETQMTGTLRANRKGFPDFKIIPRKQHTSDVTAPL